MTEPFLIDKRKNKNFVIQNRYTLKKYAVRNYQKFGKGVIIINLLLLDTDILTKDDLINYQAEEKKDITLHQTLSYIPENSFWFKVIYLKIRKQHQIDIKEKYDFNNQSLIIFIKDASVEHFSIYALKLKSENNKTQEKSVN